MAKSELLSFKIGTSQLRETTLREKTSALQDSRGLGVGLTTASWKNTLVTKCEEAIAGYFSWQKL
jgi:hypothetical protein